MFDLEISKDMNRQSYCQICYVCSNLSARTTKTVGFVSHYETLLSLSWFRFLSYDWISSTLTFTLKYHPIHYSHLHLLNSWLLRISIKSTTGVIFLLLFHIRRGHVLIAGSSLCFCAALIFLFSMWGFDFGVSRGEQL